MVVSEDDQLVNTAENQNKVPEDPNEQIDAKLAEVLAVVTTHEENNEELLNNVLPKSIAARLKKKEPTIADGFQNASILFADLTGFTRLSLKLKPNDLVEMLDTIFSRFDELVDQYGLEKIKTIGDEYMVASGIPIPREDHAEALANFALAMRDSLHEYNQNTCNRSDDNGAARRYIGTACCDAHEAGKGAV